MERKNVFVVGCNGRMGRLVYDLAQKSEDLNVVYGFDQHTSAELNIGIYTSVEQFLSDATTISSNTDVIVDFSNPSATLKILPWAAELDIPVVIATTGFTPEEETEIKCSAERIPIFKSSNMAYSTKAFIETVRFAAKRFQPPYEFSIHEIHHHDKKDAPSGTAKMLFDAINEAHGSTLSYRFDSNGLKGEKEVWVSSERVGSFRGEHTVTIAGPSDFVQFKHFVNDRGVFAEGALEAARYIMRQTEPRIYTMDDLFNE